MPQQYPFSAIVGCEPDAPGDMGLALILTTISPDIGGVLIRGEKGTAKSTAVRALSAVLPDVAVYSGDRFSIDPDDPTASSPDGPFEEAGRIRRPARLVELPVGATEDRVIGSIQLERALSAGKIDFEPGLLARAHRGLLYVDEVNLLHDHLVDLLLDAAAMGRVTVERDGMSIEHAARFVLIGTMNPEEGELRPQLLDRFGLTVEIAASRDPQVRVDVVRRRMAYDADPEGFIAHYKADDEQLTERIASAQRRLGSIALSDVALMKIAEVCAAFEVDGLRADIVMARTAIAHAAWRGADQVTKNDIRVAALLALPHRRRRNPFDAPGLDTDLLDQILGDDDLPEPPDDDPQPPPDRADDSGDSDNSDNAHESTPSQDAPDRPRDDSGPDSSHDDTRLDPSEPAAAESSEAAEVEEPAPSAGPAAPLTTVGTAEPYRPKLFTVAGLGRGSAGRRSRALSDSGTRIGAVPSAQKSGPLHVLETLMAAAGQQPHREREGNRVALAPQDLRTAIREGREANLILFCVDASGSMAARKRMTQVKTAILSLLLDAYRRRDKVGLVTFRGAGADVLLPPTGSVEAAAARLEQMPAGGRTPLAEGLLEAGAVLTRERLRDPSVRPLLVLITDGRATSGINAVDRSRQAAGAIAALGVTTILIDSETGPLRMGLARHLSVLLGAEYLPVDQVNAEALDTSVRSHLDTRRVA